MLIIAVWSFTVGIICTLVYYFGGCSELLGCSIGRVGLIVTGLICHGLVNRKMANFPRLTGIHYHVLIRYDVNFLLDHVVSNASIDRFCGAWTRVRCFLEKCITFSVS